MNPAELQTRLIDTDLAFRVTDRFGDYGIVGAVLTRADGEALHIDVFLLSCRALGRRVEQEMLSALAEVSRGRFTRLVGVYRPTPRNHIVSRFYAENGFVLVSESPDESVWELPL